MAWPINDAAQDTRASPAGEGQGALRRRRRRRRRRRVARARQGRDRAGRGRLGAAARRRSGSRRRWRPDAPLVHEELGTNDAGTLEHRGRLARAAPWPVGAVLRGSRPRQGQGGVLPRPPDPERDRAARCRRRPERRPWASTRSTRSTQIPHILRTTLVITCGIPEAKLRVVAPDVGGGFGSKLECYPEDAICLALAKKLDRPVKWVEERSENYVATLHGREMFQQIELAATRDGDLKAVRVKLNVSMGAYLRPGLAGDRDARRVALSRVLRVRRLRPRVHERVHEPDLHRRLPRRRAARGDVRDRAGDGHARARARHGPGRAAAEELHPDGQVPELHDRERAHGRLGRLRGDARALPRGARLRRDPGRAGRAARARRPQAARRRLLDLDRDVRSRALPRALGAELRRRRAGTRPRSS